MWGDYHIQTKNYTNSIKFIDFILCLLQAYPVMSQAAIVLNLFKTGCPGNSLLPAIMQYLWDSGENFQSISQDRIRKHKSDFRRDEDRGSTILSDHIWDLKDQNVNF